MRPLGTRNQAFGGQPQKGSAKASPFDDFVVSNKRDDGETREGVIDFSGRRLKQVPPEALQLDAKGYQVSKNGVDFSNDTSCWWDLGATRRVDISSNELTTFPSLNDTAWKDIESLVVSHNKLEECPSHETLKMLNVSNNRIRAIDIDQDFPLVDLKAANNQITTVSPIPTLEVLDVEKNQITSLPFFAKLVKLNISSNKITQLPQLPFTLAECIATNNKLINLPEFPPGFRFLDVSQNQLTQLNVAGPVVDTVMASYNRLSSCELLCPKLTVFIASNNVLTEVPRSVYVDSKDIQTLDVSNNDISTIPPELGLTALRRIAFDGNPLRGIRPTLVHGGAEELKKYLRTRLPEQKEAVVKKDSKKTGHLACTGTASALATIDHRALDGITSLDLAFCNVDAPLPVMKKLTIKNSKIAQPFMVPPGVAEVAVINCGMDWIEFHDDLKFGDFCRNALREIPLGPCLIELHLSANCLSGTVDIECATLCTLDISNNQITALSPYLPHKLPCLTTLLVQNNNISKVPPEFGHWETMQQLKLEGNPLRQMNAVIPKGTLAIKEWLKKR